MLRVVEQVLGKVVGSGRTPTVSAAEMRILVETKAVADKNF